MEAAERQKTGVRAGGIGLGLNLLLFLGKLFAGILTGSVAILADAFNNLSDAGSSIITLIGFRLSAQKPDPEHPYGHGRLEYIAGLMVSLLILLCGFELMKSSVEKIAAPEPVAFSWVSAGILLAAVGVKVLMFFLYRATGKKIGSATMQAAATDSLGDCFSTGVVLLSMLAQRLWGLSLDGIAGAVVALLILWGGVKAVRETISPLLGQAPDEERVKAIEAAVLAHPAVVGVHDFMLHSYGPGREFLSLHAEVDAQGELLALHDEIDNIERELRERFGVFAVIHMDPVLLHDPETERLKALTARLLAQIDKRITFHDFRIVPGPSHTNLIFDVVIPFDDKLPPDCLKRRIAEALREEEPSLFAVVTVDQSYIG